MTETHSDSVQRATTQPTVSINTVHEPRPAVSELNGVISSPDVLKQKRYRRRYQLHLWISEKEYTMLKELAELHDEPMSRIVRRLFSQLQHRAQPKAS